MRYLLLIVACSVMGLAVESTELAKINQEVTAKVTDAQAIAVEKLIDYRKREFPRLVVPDLPKDPKKSEIEQRDMIISINTFHINFDAALSRKKSHGYVNYPELWQLVANADDVRRRMIATGAQVKQEDEKSPDATAPAPKPKEKKKITAVLADGTKIE